MIVFKDIKILKPNQALIQTVLPLSLVGWKKIPKTFQNSIFIFHFHFQSPISTPNIPNKTGMKQQPKTHFTFNLKSKSACFYSYLNPKENVVLIIV